MGHINPRCRVPPNTIPSENDKEVCPCLHFRPRPSPEKLQIDGMRILFKFAGQKREEREREMKRDVNLQFQNIPASLQAKKRASRKSQGGGKGGEI